MFCHITPPKLAGESTVCLMIINHILGCSGTTKLLQNSFLLKVIVTLSERGAQIGKLTDFQNSFCKLDRQSVRRVPEVAEEKLKLSTGSAAGKQFFIYLVPTFCI